MKPELIISILVLCLQARSTNTARLFGIQAGLGDDRRNTLFINRIGQCEGFEKLPTFLQDCRIAQLNTTHYVVSSNLIFHKAYEGNISGAVRVDQCNSTGHCKPFTSTIPFGDSCGFLKAIDPSLIFVKKRITPVFECPFRVGVYRFEDILMDNVVFRYLSPHVSNDWRVVITAVHQDHMIYCVSMDLSVYDWEEMVVKTKYH